MTDLRQRARTWPRPVLFLVLSLLIEVVRPGFHPVTHRHAGGDGFHTHLGAPAGSTAGSTSGATSGSTSGATSPAHLARRIEDGRPSLAHAVATGLHQHLLQTFQLARLPLLPPLAPSPWTRAAPVLPRPRLTVAALRACRARAPPLATSLA